LLTGNQNQLSGNNQLTQIIIPMTERLLQFIWQFQFFNKSELVTIDGDELKILFPGMFNTNQGPDFSDAKIKIGKTTWAGTVELHLQPGDWVKHNHHTDKNYNNVVLHVVWEGSRNSVPAATERSSVVPVLELKGRVSKLLLDRYEVLMNSSSFIPCENLRIHDSYGKRHYLEKLERQVAG
jgi:hypothetical protein